MTWRRHQRELIETLKAMNDTKVWSPSSLTVHVWPGGGKTVLPVIATHMLKVAGLIDKVAILVPSVALKKQNAKAFKDETFRQWLNHNLEVYQAGNEANPSKGFAGYVTTHKAITADAAGIHLDEFRRHRYLLVIDEAHHVYEGSDAHLAIQPLFDAARFRILMTGTIDRNEQDRIAFMEYEDNLRGRKVPRTHIQYGLGDCLQEKANIPITFSHVDGQGSYLGRDGNLFSFGTLNEENRDNVWTAINSNAYADALLEKCLQSWRSYRRTNRRSQMLVVCAKIDQARRVKKVLEGMNTECAIATSDLDDAQGIIDRFRDYGTPQVLVTVAMAYEGLDVPALTHLACLTHIRSFPWLMQMFGRVMRYDKKAGDWHSQEAFAFVPDDPWMERAIDYIKAEQALGVDESKEADEDSPVGGRRCSGGWSR